MLHASTVSVLISSAADCPTAVRLLVGTKVSDSGRASPMFASFRLPLPCLTVADVCATLRKLGAAPVNVTMPRETVSGHVVLQLRPVYSGNVLADVVEKLHAPATPAPKRRKGKDGDNGTAENAAAEGNGTAEHTATNGSAVS